MNDPVVIVGASMGGLRTAEALRRNGYLGQIKIIGDEVHQPYNRPPLSKEVLANSVSHNAVKFPHALAEENTNWILGTKVLRADPWAHKVFDEFGNEHPYSALVIATGLRPRKLNLQNADAHGSHALRTLDDAIALREKLVPGAKVVIVGAGFIGCEVASTALSLGCEVTLVAADAHPMVGALGTEFASELQRRHESLGVTYFLTAGVEEIITRESEDGPQVSGLRLTNGETLECDVLVQAIGSHTNTEWLQNSGLDTTDGVLTNGAMQAIDAMGNVVPNVFAVGDVARFPNPIFDDVPRRVEHWNIPVETAKRVGQVVAAKLESNEKFQTVVAQYFAPIPSFWSDQFDLKLLAFGNLALADESRFIFGERSGDCVWGYYRDGVMVGVCGIGLRSVVQSYRMSIKSQASTTPNEQD
jgi:3-phenylpropionate/trans-cinnamate dioxygenase ferredoxin reductase component